MAHWKRHAVTLADAAVSSLFGSVFLQIIDAEGVLVVATPDTARWLTTGQRKLFRLHWKGTLLSDASTIDADAVEMLLFAVSITTSSVDC